jgi:membrane fusion protein (multidrug efflux system)
MIALMLIYIRRFLKFWFILVAVHIAMGCAEGEETPGKEKSQAQPVEVFRVAPSSFRETVRGIGTLEAKETVEIRPELTGIIDQVHFREGQKVKDGKLLYTIDDSKLKRQLAQNRSGLEAGKATLENAQRDFARMRELREREVISQDKFDQVETDLETARAELKRLEAAVALTLERLKDTRISAPVDGVVSESSVDPGDLVEDGDHLVTLYDTSAMEMAFKIPERYIGRIQQGQMAEITLDAYPDRPFKGKVTFVSPSVDERTRNFLVKVRVDRHHGLLRPGSFATAEVILAVHENQPYVPEEALVATREGYVVYVIEDGKARKRSVRVGLRRPGIVEIVQGLETGEEVVRSGHLRLSAGDKVKIIDDKTGSNEPALKSSTEHREVEKK